MDLSELSRPDKHQNLHQQFAHNKHDYEENSKALSGKIGEQKEAAQSQLLQKNKHSVFGRPGRIGIKDSLNNFQIREEPFWLRREEGT